MVAPVGGFGRFKSNVGGAIGGLSLANFQDEANMANAALAARNRLKAARAGADATRFAGQQMANATMFGGVMNGIGSLAGGVIGGLGNMNAGNRGGTDTTEDFKWGSGDIGQFDANYDWRPGPDEFQGSWQASPPDGWGLTGW